MLVPRTQGEAFFLREQNNLEKQKRGDIHYTCVKNEYDAIRLRAIHSVVSTFMFMNLIEDFYCKLCDGSHDRV